MRFGVRTVHSVREIQTDKTITMTLVGERGKRKEEEREEDEEEEEEEVGLLLVDTKMESNLETIFKIKVIR